MALLWGRTAGSQRSSSSRFGLLAGLRWVGAYWLIGAQHIRPRPNRHRVCFWRAGLVAGLYAEPGSRLPTGKYRSPGLARRCSMLDLPHLRDIGRGPRFNFGAEFALNLGG